MSGWEEIGAKNHIVVKKNFILFIFVENKLEFQIIKAKKTPKLKTKIVKNLYIGGRINGVGLKSKKIV